MNTTPSDNPPAQTGQFDCQQATYVLIHIPRKLFLAESPMLHFQCISMQLLCEVMDLNLAAGGLTAKVNAGGSLNSGLCLVQNEDRHACIRLIQELLKRHGLMEWSSLYYYDGREQIYRAVHVGIGGKPTFGQNEADAELARYRGDLVKASMLLALAVENIAKQNPPPLLPPIDPPPQNPS